MNFLPKFNMAVFVCLVFASQAVAQINTPLRVKDENEPEEIKQVLVDFQHYVVRAVQYPSKANKNSIQKTLHYTLQVNGDNTVSDFKEIDSIPEAEEDAVFPFYFTAPSYGPAGKEDPAYDKDFRSTVEKAAKKFNRYKSKSQAGSQTTYFSFNFVIKR